MKQDINHAKYREFEKNSDKNYSDYKNKDKESIKQILAQDEQQTCSTKIKKGFNQLTDKAANFLECTRLFSDQKMEQIKNTISNHVQQQINNSSVSANTQEVSNISKMSTKQDINSQKKLGGEKQGQLQIQIPVKNYSIQHVFKINKRYLETYDESYSQRQARFGLSFQEAELKRKRQYEVKKKTFWGELKRLLLCQGGNYVQDFQQVEKARQLQLSQSQHSFEPSFLINQNHNGFQNNRDQQNVKNLGYEGKMSRGGRSNIKSSQKNQEIIEEQNKNAIHNPKRAQKSRQIAQNDDYPNIIGHNDANTSNNAEGNNKGPYKTKQDQGYNGITTTGNNRQNARDRKRKKVSVKTGGDYQTNQNPPSYADNPNNQIVENVNNYDSNYTNPSYNTNNKAQDNNSKNNKGNYHNVYNNGVDNNGNDNYNQYNSYDANISNNNNQSGNTYNQNNIGDANSGHSHEPVNTNTVNNRYSKKYASKVDNIFENLQQDLEDTNQQNNYYSNNNTSNNTIEHNAYQSKEEYNMQQSNPNSYQQGYQPHINSQYENNSQPYQSTPNQYSQARSPSGQKNYDDHSRKQMYLKPTDSIDYNSINEQPNSLPHAQSNRYNNLDDSMQDQSNSGFKPVNNQQPNYGRKKKTKKGTTVPIQSNFNQQQSHEAYESIQMNSINKSNFQSDPNYEAPNNNQFMNSSYSPDQANYNNNFPNEPIEENMQNLQRSDVQAHKKRNRKVRKHLVIDQGNNQDVVEIQEL